MAKSNFFKELKRRRVFKSAAVYAVVAFVVMQLVEIIFPIFNFPDWTSQFVIILLIFGFPIAMVFAWIYDRTPRGFVKTDSVSQGENVIADDGFPKDKEGNSAIVFLDIVDFSKLMDQDEKKAIDLIHYKQKVFVPYVEKYGGKLIKRVGEGTLCVFSDAARAVCCSLEILQTWKNISPLKLKIGVHLDKIVVEQGEVLGKGINFGARIKDLAESGGITISSAVFEAVKDRPDINVKSIGKHTIEGFDGIHELFSIFVPDQFIPMDIEVGAAQMGQISAQKVNYRSLIGWVGGVVIASVALLQVANYFGSSKMLTATNMIAVFPFENIRDDEKYDWLRDQFSESLTFRLGQSKTLKVIDRLQIINALQDYEPEKAGFAELAPVIGKKVNANLVLLGSYTIYGEEIQIITKIINAETGELIPVIQERYPLDDPLSMLADISNKVFERVDLLAGKKVSE